MDVKWEDCVSPSLQTAGLARRLVWLLYLLNFVFLLVSAVSVFSSLSDLGKPAVIFSVSTCAQASSSCDYSNTLISNIEYTCIPNLPEVIGL